MTIMIIRPITKEKIVIIGIIGIIEIIEIGTGIRLLLEESLRIDTTKQQKQHHQQQPKGGNKQQRHDEETTAATVDPYSLDRYSSANCLKPKSSAVHIGRIGIGILFGSTPKNCNGMLCIRI